MQQVSKQSRGLIAAVDTYLSSIQTFLTGSWSRGHTAGAGVSRPGTGSFSCCSQGHRLGHSTLLPAPCCTVLWATPRATHAQKRASPSWFWPWMVLPARCMSTAHSPPPWLSPCHPANDKAFRRGWIIISARYFSRSPRLANSASSLSRYVRSRKRAGMAQLSAPGGAVGWRTRTLGRAQRGAGG